VAKLNLEKLRKHIQSFEFQKLFNELGWSNPSSNRETELENGFRYKQIAQLSSVVILEISVDEMPDAKARLTIHEKIAPIYHEHVLIFVDSKRTQSCFFWMKRENGKHYPRTHFYFQAQSGELLLSKLAAMNVDFSEFDESGNIAIVDVAKRLKTALDIEPITKKFFKDFEQKHGDFVEQIHGIDSEKDRAWYASVLLHRLMFIWFLQKKGFIDKGNLNYLNDKLTQIQKNLIVDGFYREFLKPLFFEGFAKPKNDRSTEINKLLGDVRYLNGGLFLPHQIEERYNDKIQVSDKAFEDLFALFGQYSWNLNDTVGGNDNEINPDVLGYIFEKYINQKAFGAYYTRPEITDYLCERTISKLILDRINTPATPELNLPARQFKDLPELLFKLDAPLCRELLNKILPELSLLDPSCGSGAFLVAAMKTLIDVYSAIIGKIKFLNDANLTQWLEATENTHPNIHYFIKKEIIKNNLYGVDIMPEATEIAKLRLFLALVSSAKKVDDLEPLPNIDFNIMAGNSLIGLLNVEGEKFNAINKTGDIFADSQAQTYQHILQEKNRLIASYKDSSTYSENLTELRDNIIEFKNDAYEKLNALLLAEFERLQIKYEQATWDDAKNKEGKPTKRALTYHDISKLQPFHWGFEFDQIFARGGFDAIITNPPWEVFKPQAKEFFADYSELVTKNKMTIKDFEKEQKILLSQPETRAAWLEYQSRFPFLNLYFRSSSQYQHQIAAVNGKKAGADINLYKLFTEQSFNLLKQNGECGIVIPSGIYTDLGATGLRHLLFNETNITGLFCFENRKTIFEGVDSRFKFVVLTFVKNTVGAGSKPAHHKHNTVEIKSPSSNDDVVVMRAGLEPAPTQSFPAAFMRHVEIKSPSSNDDVVVMREGLEPAPTQSFPAAFMRHDVAELNNFPNPDSLQISTNLIKKLSPDSQSIMEFKNETDIKIAEKMLAFPLLGEQLENTWNLKLTREFHMTDDSRLFEIENIEGCLPLFECKMIHQFSSNWGQPEYWIDEEEGRKALLGKAEDVGQVLDYQDYRLAYRAIGRNTDIRTMIASIIPPCFAGNSINISKSLNVASLLFCVSFLNSFVADWLLRQKVSANVNMFYVYQLPIPRLTETDPRFKAIVERAAGLICVSEEFEDLKRELVAKGYELKTDAPEILRAELDGLVAKLYDLTAEEFAHILKTFPIVKEDVKTAAMAAFLKLEKT